MNRLFVALIIVVNAVYTLHAQCDSTLAPEIWSEPVLLPDVINLNTGAKQYPRFSYDGKRLFYWSTMPKYCIVYSNYIDDVWSEPAIMPATLSDSLYARSNCLSPDGKTFYFSKQIQGNQFERWGEIYYCTWDDSSNAWSLPLALDTAINSYLDEPTVTISPDAMQLYFATNEPVDRFGGRDFYVCDWDEATNTWGQKRNVGENVNFNNRCIGGVSEDFQCSFAADFKKMYFDKNMGPNFNYEIFVSYKETNGDWGRATRINLNAYADTGSLDPYQMLTGLDKHPAIHPDGTMLVFAGTRNAFDHGTTALLYASYLLVDENGDTVTTNIEKFHNVNPSLISVEPFPNPFTNSLSVKINTSRITPVIVQVFNMAGMRQNVLYRGNIAPGNHTFIWNGSSEAGNLVPPGVYLIVVNSKGFAYSKIVVKQ